MFELNNFEELTIQEINGTRLYIKDNFYKYPDEVLKILNTTENNYWKIKDQPSFNGVHFADKRHDFYHKDLLQVNTKLEEICGQKTAQPGQVVTNCIQFFDKEFNNYKNNYWGPHEDLGYTALIYLNDFDCPGTNFYTRLQEDIWETPEHFDPWRSKEKFDILYTVESKYNRMVLFDGRNLTHGMAINDETFFDILRINQVIFFNSDF